LTPSITTKRLTHIGDLHRLIAFKKLAEELEVVIPSVLLIHSIFLIDALFCLWPTV